jgi:Major Facilitator Superfamily
MSTSMRVQWARLVGDDDRTAAYSLVYLVQELAILTGPLILAGAIAVASPAVALIVVAALTAVGGVGFAASARAPEGASRAARSPGFVLRVRAVRLVLAMALFVGAAIGALEVAAATLATAHHAPAAAGILIASLSIGGILGAVVYAGRRWHSAPARRLVRLLALVTVALAITIAAHGLVIVAVLLLSAGIGLNPALTTFSLIIDQHVPERAAGEAFGWLSTAIAGGTGGASAIAAALAQHHHDAQAAFVVAAVAAAGAAIVSAFGARTLSRRS